MQADYRDTQDLYRNTKGQIFVTTNKEDSVIDQDAVGPQISKW